MVRHLDRERRVLHQKPLSLSFGVVQIAANESMTDATHRADLALQQAKQQGRGRAVAGAPNPVPSARAADHSASPEADTNAAPDADDLNDTEASQRRRSSDLGDGAQG